MSGPCQRTRNMIGMRHESSCVPTAVGRLGRVGHGRACRRVRRRAEHSGRERRAALLRRGRSNRPDSGPPRSHLPYHRVPPALPRRRAADGRRARRQSRRRAQLWTRRQRLVAGVGRGRRGGVEGSGRRARQPRRGGRRVRSAGIDGRHHRAACRPARDDLCEGASARRAVGAGDRRMEPRLAHRLDLGGGARVRRPVGSHGPHVVRDVPKLSWDAGHAD